MSLGKPTNVKELQGAAKYALRKRKIAAFARHRDGSGRPFEHAA